MDTRRVILFSDVCESTRLLRLLGERQGLALVDAVLDLLRRAIASHDGRVIDRIGDELMCSFDVAEAAVAAAVELNRTIQASHGPGSGEARVRMRTGLHWGAVQMDGAHPRGDTVHTAKRMVTLAKPGQILLTSETIAALRTWKGEEFRFVDRVKLKGRDVETEIQEVLWESEGVTFIQPPSDAESQTDLRNEAPRLEVSHGGKVWCLERGQPGLTIGRDAACTVVFSAGSVSRQHARIDLRKRHFFLTDTSANGTFLRPQGRDPLFLHRDEVTLPRGKGEIAPAKSDPSLVLHYSFQG